MPAFTSIAAGIGAAASVAGSAASMMSGSSAAQAAAQAQVGALKSAERERKYEFDIAREDVAPWRIAGEEALRAYSQMLGLGEDMSVYEKQLAGLGPGPQWEKTIPRGYTGETWTGTPAGGEGEVEGGEYGGYIDPTTGQRIKRSAKYENYLKEVAKYRIEKERLENIMAAPKYEPEELLKSTPGYQFRLGEGINALERSAAARGSQLSGQQLKAVQQYGEGMAAQEYNSLMGRLAGLAGVGQAAAGTQANLAAQGGQMAAQNIAAQGQARASGYINQANAFSGGLAGMTSGINSGVQNYMLYNALNRGY